MDFTTTSDAFLGGQLNITQPQKGYRAGSDAVFLGASVSHEVQSLVDLGAGVGTASLCAAWRLPQLRVIMIERDDDIAQLAKHNIQANGLHDRAIIHSADILAQWSQEDIQKILLPDINGVDAVIANPPYFNRSSSQTPDMARRADAHQMNEDDLLIWIKLAWRLLAPNGTLTLIHRVEMLPVLLRHMQNRFGRISVLPLQSHISQSPERMLIRGQKGSKAPFQLKPALLVHNENHQGYSPYVESILRDGQAINWPEN